MAQTQHDYNELFYGVNGQPALIRDGSLTASLGALVKGTMLTLDPATNKYVLFDSASVAAVTAVAAPAVTTVEVIKTQDPEAKEAVVKTVAAPAVTTAAIATTNAIGAAILLEDITVTDSVTAKVGLAGGIDADKIVMAGSTITTVTEFVKAILRMNNIFVRTGTNAIAVAGE